MSLVNRLSASMAKVQLSISCRGLLNKDKMSKSDPCAVVYSVAHGGLTELGRTETIKNNLNPDFTKKVQVEYSFEETQRLRIAVYDIDNKSVKLTDDDFLGYTECTLGQVVASTYTSHLILEGKKEGKKAKGSITISATEMEREKSTEVLHLRVGARGLDKKDTMGKSDPFLEFYRQTGDAGWELAHRTEVVKKNLNPQWKPMQISINKLCDGHFNAPIRVLCNDYDGKNKHELIGEFVVTVADLMEIKGGNEKNYPCINPKRAAKKKGYTDSGTVVFRSCEVVKDHTFLDFVLGGLDIHFTVGVDFSKANREFSSPLSLHYLEARRTNAYMQAISAVGAVIQDYDSDRSFPAIGFGAKVPPDYEVSQQFPLNFRKTDPFCPGVQGVLEAYQECLGKIRAGEPCEFAPAVYHVAQFAAASRAADVAKNYFVLLLLTAGQISDLEETISAIVYASGLPMSIIIVGVGDGDFSDMETLDADDGLLKDQRNNKAVRDIVQFVALRDFTYSSGASLAKNVLAEVPRQLRDYFRSVNLEPGAPTRKAQSVTSPSAHASIRTSKADETLSAYDAALTSMRQTSLDQ